MAMALGPRMWVFGDFPTNQQVASSMETQDGGDCACRITLHGRANFSVVKGNLLAAVIAEIRLNMRRFDKYCSTKSKNGESLALAAL